MNKTSIFPGYQHSKETQKKKEGKKHATLIVYTTFTFLSIVFR